MAGHSTYVSSVCVRETDTVCVCWCERDRKREFVCLRVRDRHSAMHLPGSVREASVFLSSQRACLHPKWLSVPLFAGESAEEDIHLIQKQPIIQS